MNAKKAIGTRRLTVTVGVNACRGYLVYCMRIRLQTEALVNFDVKIYTAY